MKRLKIIIACILAFLCIPVVLATFIGMDPISRWIVYRTGIRVSPWNTGGDVSRVIDHGAWRTMIHQPVFQGLIGERDQGFVQVDWLKRTSWPETIDETIDYDHDGKADFRLLLRKGETVQLESFQPFVTAISDTLYYAERKIIRIRLKNPARL